MQTTYEVCPVRWVVSQLTDRAAAPKQGDEGAPPTRIVVRPELAEAMADLVVDTTVIVLTWLHEADRSVLSVHPRGDGSRPRAGVFPDAIAGSTQPGRAARRPDRRHRRHHPRRARSGGDRRHLVLDIKPVLGPPDVRR